MLTNPMWNAFALGFLAVAVLIGCGKTSPPESNQQPDANHAAAANDPDDVHITADDVKRPANYAAAVARITSYRDTIRDQIAAGRPGKAHRPLDEMNFIVEWLPEIAQQSNVPKENWEALNTAAQTIRTLLDKVHENIDNGDEPDFNAVADGIQESIDTLESIHKSDANNKSPETDGNESDAPDQGEHQ